jgi:hypothetical protein
MALKSAAEDTVIGTLKVGKITTFLLERSGSSFGIFVSDGAWAGAESSTVKGSSPHSFSGLLGLIRDGNLPWRRLLPPGQANLQQAMAAGCVNLVFVNVYWDGHAAGEPAVLDLRTMAPARASTDLPVAGDNQLALREVHLDGCRVNPRQLHAYNYRVRRLVHIG